jgi:hypothetical protein
MERLAAFGQQLTTAGTTIHMPVTTFLISSAVLVAVGSATAAIAAQPALISMGSASVSSCSAGAHLTPHVGYDPATSGYLVTIVEIATNSGCAGLAYHLSLLGTGHERLAESTGHLGRSGSANADFTQRSLAADELGGVAITLTGKGRIYFR